MVYDDMCMFCHCSRDWKSKIKVFAGHGPSEACREEFFCVNVTVNFNCQLDLIKSRRLVKHTAGHGWVGYGSVALSITSGASLFFPGTLSLLYFLVAMN